MIFVHFVDLQVEYLHQLVLKSLEFLTQKKNGAKKSQDKDDSAEGISSNNQNKNQFDEDLLTFGNDEASFLLLDHLIEEGNNIDLPTVVSKSQQNTSLDTSFDNQVHFCT